MENNKSKIILNAVWGALIGLLFPIIATSLSILTTDKNLSFGDILALHKQNPSYLLLDIIPVLAFLLTYFFSKNVYQKTDMYANTIESEQEKSEHIFDFVEKLRDGNTKAEYELYDDNDVLGKSLINLRNELVRSKEEEEVRRKEDDQRHWATEGIAKFSEILRQYNSNMEEMSYQVVSNLVKYLKIAQGGLFIIEEKEDKSKYFKQYASYAYDRKKFSEKIVEWGEGLVGACGLEKETIYMDKVTEGYVSITSGLGQSNPRSILIVPLKTNDIVFGVVELASFKAIEKYRIEFVEKLAESIASTISSYKINYRTARLLKESQNQAQKMAEQEDLLRKNLQELQQTQEEAAKQSEEFISFTNSVNHTLIRAEYNVDGTLIYANTKFLQKLGYIGNSEVEGRHISMFINKKDTDWFNKIWDTLAKGGRHFEDYMKHVTKEGKDLWTMATYTCVRDKEGGVQKILFLAIDTTEEKKQSLDYEGQIEALNLSTFKAEFTPTGKILECNTKLLTALEYNLIDLQDKTFFDFLVKTEVPEFRKIWANIIGGTSFEGQIKKVTKTRSERWFHGSLSAVHDMYGDIAKIIFIASDISEQKQMEFKNKQQTEQLKLQEEKLQQSEIDLSHKLDETREEMKHQFKKIEVIKMLNEKTLEGMYDAVVSINNAGIVEFFNEAAEDLWAWKRGDVVGENIEILLPSEYAEQGENYMGNYFKHDTKDKINGRTEVFIINKAKERIPVLLTLSEARIGTEYRLTAFIQNIEVEIF